ncbi:hypothetical protein GALL_191010 [mine drainage metagenome]|uniref:Thioredoxin-like fold domain-containing protein n=1 Tax=mine drainage metagenome TaxID=410659 RepID=A0A1J5SAT8_9ZZZZ
MKTIEILGGGCAKCNQLAANAETAAKSLKLDYTLVKVTDFREISRRGILTTPALALDGKTLSAGKVLTQAQIEDLLR